jgi:NAD(P)-dependent dehydrogenase (short-subunit alcohol dehydrogenase family)
MHSVLDRLGDRSLVRGTGRTFAGGHPMNDRLAGRVAIVTGGGQGIGAAISQRFCEAGARVVIAQRTSAIGETHAVALRAAGYTAIAVRTDVAVRAEVEALVERTIAEVGLPDILVNNAGISVFRDPLTMTDDDWRECFAVDLEGAWHAIRAVLPHMLAAGRGSIVNVASNHAFQIIPGCFPYPVAKHALIGMTRALAIEYGARGVRVNAVCPAYIETKAATDYWDTFPDPAAERRRADGLHPIGRVGQPDEVAWPVLFLASDEASFINGESLMIDAGMHVVVNGHGTPFVTGIGPSGVTPGSRS